MGIKVEHVPFAELNEAWKQADKDESRAVADRWAKEAKRIEGVTRGDAGDFGGDVSGGEGAA